jgi:hypothetical protein
MGLVQHTIILFAKAPVPGRVKTRLGVPFAEALHQAFVWDAIELASTMGAVEIHSDSDEAPWPVARLQAPGDLGARMLAALGGRTPALILGSDAPTLPPGHLAAVLLSPADVTLGPTQDGGYYAIHARRIHPNMFDGVEWSSGRELAETLAACRACGLSVALGPEWWDVDTPGDLSRLAASPILPANTAELLYRLGLRDHLKEYGTSEGGR